uniref:BAR domain-containing protein n=1 Tax=Steinernema glaseri TaxID=37863 RepID=A0A1I8A4S2_9BILA
MDTRTNTTLTSRTNSGCVRVMADLKRVDIGALALDFDERMAALSEDKKLEDARMECLEAIEMLRKAHQAAELSEEYVRNSMALMAEEFRESRITFDNDFRKDYEEIRRVKEDFDQEAAPIVDDIARLQKEVMRSKADLEALRKVSKKSVANSDDTKHILRKKYATQADFNEYFEKLKGLEKTSKELLQNTPQHRNYHKPSGGNPGAYYGTVEGTVLIPEAFHAVRELEKELDKLCGMLGTDGMEDVRHFRSLTSQLTEMFEKQVTFLSPPSKQEAPTVAPSEASTATSDIRVPFIDEISTILMQPSAGEVPPTSSDCSYSDFGLTSDSSEYLTSVES